MSLEKEIKKHIERQKKQLLLELGNAAIFLIRQRLKRGEGLNGKMPPLSKSYADKHKGGDRTRNLLLSGRTLGSLTSEVQGDAVVIRFADQRSQQIAEKHHKKYPWFGLTEQEKKKLAKILKEGR